MQYFPFVVVAWILGVGLYGIVTSRHLDPLETVDVRLVLPLRSDGARPGRHTLAMRVNGRLDAVVDFTVVM